MITPSQIRAARGLLRWNQGDLADRAAMSVPAIANIELEKQQPTIASLEKIEKAFVEAGIDIMDDGGVRPKQVNVAVYQGKQGFADFMGDVYNVAAQHGGDIYLFNSRPKLWHEWLGAEWYDMHSKRMAALGDKIRVRISVQEGDHYTILSSAQHRWFPSNLTKDKICYVYGPKLAFLDFNENNVKITVITHGDFAEIFRVLYGLAWDHASQPIPTEAS